MSDLFVFAPIEPVLSLNEDAVPMIVNEYMRQDDEGRFRMFKLFAATARYTLPETFLMAQCMLALITGGADAFDEFVMGEFEAVIDSIVAQDPDLNEL